MWQAAVDYLSAKYRYTRFKTRYYCRFGILLLQTIYNGINDGSALGQLMFIGLIYMLWVLYSTGIYSGMEILKMLLSALLPISVTLMMSKERGTQRE